MPPNRARPRTSVWSGGWKNARGGKQTEHQRWHRAVLYGFNGTEPARAKKSAALRTWA
jgi:hypothetical protein